MSEKNEKQGLSCAVVRDLLPLYVEGLTQEETGEAVKDHVSRCPDCAQALGMQQAQLENVKLRTKNDQKLVRLLKNTVYKRVLIISLAVLAVLATVFLTVNWLSKVETVPPEDISIAGKYQLPDGRIMIAVKAKGLSQRNVHSLYNLAMSLRLDSVITSYVRDVFDGSESMNPWLLNSDHSSIKMQANITLMRFRWNRWFSQSDQRGDFIYLLFDPVHYSEWLNYHQQLGLMKNYDWKEEDYPIERLSINGYKVWDAEEEIRRVTEEEAAQLLAAYEAQELDTDVPAPYQQLGQDAPDALDALKESQNAAP